MDAPVELGRRAARRFLRILAEDPFMCIVLVGGTDVRVFAKDIDNEQVERIKKGLEQAMVEED